jgi:hypothetical protein
MENLEARVSELKERLKRAQRDRHGKIVFLRMFDDLVDELESVLNEGGLKRFELAERLGLGLAELNSLEEEIYKQRAEENKRVADAAVSMKNDLLEQIQFQAVRVGESEPLPVEPDATDMALQMPRGLIVRIVSMTGLKVEVNSMDAALQILREVLAVHYKDKDHA